MKHLITIDQGNSHPHFAHFENGRLKTVAPLSGLEDFLQQGAQEEFSFATSSVGPQTDVRADFSAYFKDGRFLDMPVHYTQTLGQDRLYQAYFLFKNKLSGQRPLLLLDAGTFLTADWVGGEGHLGGLIFPGMKTYLASYLQAAKLGQFIPPNISLGKNFQRLAHDSPNAIAGGARLHFQSLLKQLCTDTDIEAVYLTGGEGEAMQSFLSTLGLPVFYEPHLIHWSLQDLYYRTHGRGI